MVEIHIPSNRLAKVISKRLTKGFECVVQPPVEGLLRCFPTDRRRVSIVFQPPDEVFLRGFPTAWRRVLILGPRLGFRGKRSGWRLQRVEGSCISRGLGIDVRDSHSLQPPHQGVLHSFSRFSLYLCMSGGLSVCLFFYVFNLALSRSLFRDSRCLS